MCGRFGLYSRKERLARLLGLDEKQGGDLQPRYNIAPSLCTWVVTRRSGPPAFESYRWGLLPSWVKDPQRATRPINARAETVAEKPTFARLLREQRCLVPADGYYEWKTTPSGKLPYWFTMASGEPFFFAGLWDHWGQRNELEPSFTLLTTEPNSLAAEVHDRMPVIVRPADYDLWMDPEARDPAAIAHVLKAYPAQEMRMHRVSRRVSSAAEEGPALIEPIREEEEPGQRSLL